MDDSPSPTLAVLFNESSGAAQVADIIATKHAFVEFEIWKTIDEQERAAWVLVASCETATGPELFAQIGSRLPDYIQARLFPPSRVALIRREGERVA